MLPTTMADASIARDVLAATKLTLSRSLTPILPLFPGIAAILAVCFGVDALLRRLRVAFPASVATMVLLFAGLLLCERVGGAHRTRRFLALIDLPANWSLHWISVFFTPAFVLLPLSPPIGGVEVAKIIAVFIIGFFIMMALAAYLTRALQLLVGTSKRTPPAEDDVSVAPSSFSQAASTVPLQTLPRLQLDGTPPATSLEEPPRHAAPSMLPAQAAPELARAERWARRATTHFNTVLFACLLLFVGVPLYFSLGYAMPLHLSINTLAFFAAMAIPLPWRQYLHPVLVASLLTVLVIWPLALARGRSLPATLSEYRVGAKYLQLWSRATTQAPGAGDVYATLLDASIVSLALPMFQYRRELRAHFLPIVLPSVLIAVGSLFAYPPLCFAVGITAPRSLAFASRSLTLALATPATENLGGDVNTVAALAIISGIFGVLVGQRMLAAMRIPEDDYVTRGVTLGVNSSAIATALLLRTDPRAAALSSLSMSLFGTVTVLFTAIPPITNLIRSLVSL
ncbi:LrgB-like family-domain-containing protein [Stachybotrys elegans]|uniref:LrgB-like family-domain-containing protein n=1 Tax=Stachybotrys elegans TaxID=80388 RepID=A0A8K0SW82_9HYPO|nr:LrgB-like family-domain-containing protein [Stachybotrys elegans]